MKKLGLYSSSEVLLTQEDLNSIALAERELFNHCDQYQEKNIPSHYTREDVQKALVFAYTAHYGKKRKYEWENLPSGERRKKPYFFHPLRVAKILIETFDAWTYEEVMYALLHDTIEERGLEAVDVFRSKEIIEQTFDKNISNGVLGLSKKGLWEHLQHPESQLLNLYKTQNAIIKNTPLGHIFKSINFLEIYIETRAENERDHVYLGGIKDLRESLIKVKLADRNDNLLTAGDAPIKKREEWIIETKVYLLSLASSRYPAMHARLVEVIDFLEGGITFEEKVISLQKRIKYTLDRNSPFPSEKEQLSR